ncbi:rnase h domain-containing protein [Citrus sinensis]|nr:rnase h domain-containing protein [Citrus sinensis]
MEKTSMVEYADAISSWAQSSYVWRSILATKEVVIQGSRVQLGSAHTPSIGKDPWLSDLNDGFVSSNLNDELATALVSSLMMPNQWVWDYDVVSDIFNSRDKELIMKIPLSSPRDNDLWYWLADPGAAIRFIAIIRHFLYQWQTAKQQRFDINDDAHRLVHGALCWEKPKFGWVKCNVDAVVFASQGKIGFGCVIRNSEGCFLAASCAGMAGNFGAREAEALGIRQALSWLKKLQFPCVIIEMDCLQVFRTLVENFSGPNGFGLIIEDCQSLAKSIGEVHFLFVRRYANLAAHFVAMAAGSMPSPQE